MQRKSNPDSLDCLFIKRKAKQIILDNANIRYGQAVFNAAHDKFPEAANMLRGSNFDCFCEDSKVEEFLIELQHITILGLGERDQ